MVPVQSNGPNRDSAGLTADLRLLAKDIEAANSNNLETDDRDLADAFGNLLGIFTENIADKSYFKGIADMVEAVEAGKTQGGSRMTAYLSSLVTNLIPFSSMQRNVARAHDDHAREAFSFMEKLQAQTPLWREGLPLRRDILGRPIPESERIGADWVSPFIVGKDDSDPAARALAQLDMPYQMPDKNIAGVRLDAKQYGRLLEVRGAYLKEQLSEWLSSGEWEQLSRYQKMEKVRRWTHNATTVSKTQVLDEWPELEALVTGRKQEIHALKSGALREQFAEDLLGDVSEE